MGREAVYRLTESCSGRWGSGLAGGAGVRCTEPVGARLRGLSEEALAVEAAAAFERAAVLAVTEARPEVCGVGAGFPKWLVGMRRLAEACESGM